MKERLYYLDNLRTFATVLVILHHTAITYGSSGSWYYGDPTRDEISSIILTLYTDVNQSFFMGLFFFIAGYFTPGSYDRKGSVQFIKDRLKRLGIPLLFYALLIGPILRFFLIPDRSISFTRFYIQRMVDLEIEWGPLWFVVALLYFSFAYVLWKRISSNKHEVTSQKTFPANSTIAYSALLVGITAFLIRLLVPVGQEVLGQQIGFFASYVFFFAIGIKTYRHGWLDKLTKNATRLWFGISLVLIVALPVIFVLSGAAEGNEVLFLGGFNLRALSYALWEPFTAFGIIMMLLVSFKEKLNNTNSFFSATAGSAYTVYIIHAPLLVLVSYLFRDLHLFGVLKFLLVGSVASVFIFIIAHLITRIPKLRS